jgi:sulfur-oxidizing protein SoxX
MTTKAIVLSIITLVLFAAGCTRTATSSTGFRLPDGDAMSGRETFLYMQCHQCHTISGEEFPVIPLSDPPYVALGGPVTRVKTYGELVTAIIYPSHKLANGYAAEKVSEDGESNMYVYNDYMTVQELTDLVVFLQPHYDVITPKYDYRLYP